MTKAWDECGICFDEISEWKKKGKCFGLMSSCNHVFCLECLKKWRSITYVDHELVEFAKCCPECRQFSDLVVPSKRLLTGEKKEKLLQKFRSNESLHHQCIVNGPIAIKPITNPIATNPDSFSDSQTLWNRLPWWCIIYLAVAYPAYLLYTIYIIFY